MSWSACGSPDARPGRFGSNIKERAMDNKPFWKNKNVLITGFEGFLGSNLTGRLIREKACIVGLDIKTNRKTTILTKEDCKKILVVKGDVANFRLVKKIIDQHKIDVVFHLAAEAIVGKSLKKPLRTFSSNIEGTWNVLEASRLSNTIKAIVIASSDKAYGSHDKLPYHEDYPLIGRHPYDVSKSCADLIAKAYWHTYQLPAVVTRCGNIYGPGDFNFSRIVPDAIRCALAGRSILIRSDGQFTRDYVYVDDIVRGYMMLAQNIQKLGLAGEAFNFSNENPKTVIALVEKIFRITKKEPQYEILDSAPYEIKRQYLASQKSRDVLRWEPRYSLEDGLKKTTEWYMEYFNKQ